MEVSGTRNLALAILLALSLLTPCISAQPAADQALIAQIDAAGKHRETDLLGYTVEEHYTITNSHFSAPATALVKVVYTRDAGKHYEVLSRTGPSLLANHLLDSMIADEQKLSLNPSRSQAVIASANYTFVPAGSENLHGRQCDVLTMTPKQNSTFVMNGRIWVDAKDKQLVRIDGVTPQSPSFLAGKPQIIRDYAAMHGFSLAQHSHAVSSSFFTGTTTVDIDYINYQITP